MESCINMKINKAMNIVVPVDIDGVECFVHSTPISFEVFEKYFLVISKTFSEIYSQGLSHVAAPRVASLLLKKCAKDLGELESVEKGLINEINPNDKPSISVCLKVLFSYQRMV